MHSVDPSSEDPRSVGDTWRPRAAVAPATTGEWVVFGHPETVEAACNPEVFSSRVSSHLQIPNGLDGAEHRTYRDLVDRYLGHDRMVALEPELDRVAADVVAGLPRGVTLDAVTDIGATFAVRAMTAWLGWPHELEDQLRAWVADNRNATRSRDPNHTAQVASDFDEIIQCVVAPRRASGDTSDVTGELVHDTSLGRELTDAEIVSILRNWTGGDLSSMALCIGVVLHALASQPDLARRIREGSTAEVEAIIDEILRLDDPFVSNRRVTTCPVTLGGVRLEAGSRVRLHWTSANRDERVFGAGFDERAHAEHNLVYGIGPHDCPGRELSTLELRVLATTLLRSVESLELAGEPTRESSPVGGYETVPIILDGPRHGMVEA